MLSRLRFFWVVGACGGVLMALEILSSRILAPYFGNSVYVWGSIISVFLAALSLGYLWGGRLADRQPSLAALARLLALAAACEAALLLAGSRLAGALGDWTGATPGGTLIAAAALFGPASVLLATVSPYAVRLAARDLGRLGDTAGRLYALSTFGSLGGTLIATFLLIPFFELRHVLALLTAATAATALAAAVPGPPQPAATPSPPRALPAVVLATLVLAAAGAAFLPRTRTEAELLYERTTPYQTLVVRERTGVRYLESDRVQQAAVRVADGEPAMRYARFAAASLLLAPPPRSLLSLGMGGGSVGSYLQRRLAGLHVDYVDIDPAVPEIAQRFLLLHASPRTTITIADARRFLAGAGGRAWDVIYCDTYIGRSVPFHLTTIEFLDEVKRRLAAGGSFGLNLAAGLGDPFSKAMYRTVLERFATVYLFRVGGASNVLVLATDRPGLSRPSLLAHAVELDRQLPGFDPPFTSIARARMAVGLEAVDVPLLRDEFAPVDRLIHLGAAARGEP
ncbi:MAG TPA: fused MFS/spermidine synthase [Thermoanaerobaculia bacterium]|nr:fused MFS/spermidine synthase [Thermoanaerobaculia bacterium]